MNGMEKERIKEGLEVLRSGVYRIRILIKIHELISEYASRLIHQNFWGFQQKI